MKRIFCIMCIVLTCCVQAATTPSGAASQAWVSNYVSNYVAQSTAEIKATTKTVASNGVDVVTTESGAQMIVEQATDAALKVMSARQAAQTAGITDGLLLVWNGKGAYINPAGRITCTTTNMVYNGVASVYENGLIRFAGLFDAKAVRIQPSVSHSITNGMQEVAQ